MAEKPQKPARKIRPLVERHYVPERLYITDAALIWILGGPGSGKAAQCAKIVEKFGFSHLITGDLLREEVATGSDRGKKIDEIMKKGELVPNADVVYLLKEGIRKVASSKGILIDGCPRVKDQCCDFEVAIAPIDLMIYLECTEKTMVERVLKEAKESGGKRPNDNEETVRARITTFFKNNDPILNLYTKRKKIINGDRDVDEVFADVQKCIEELMAKLNES